MIVLLSIVESANRSTRKLSDNAWSPGSRKPHPPSWLAMVHGLLAAAGMTLLAYAAATMSVPSLAIVALVLFAVAALGGVVLNLHFHLNGIPLPIWLVVVHALIAVAAFVALLLAAFGSGGA